MTRAITALVVLALGVPGCTHHIVGHADLLWKNEPLPLGLQTLGRVRGRSCVWFAPAGDFAEAVTRALGEQPDAEGLANVSITATVEDYYFASRVCVSIDADAVKANH